MKFAVTTLPMKLTFEPLTPARSANFEKLFGKNGACAGCWCMWSRLTAAEYRRGKGARNKKAMRVLVTSGEVPGILAYAGNEAVGWCSVAPRGKFPRLEHSRTLKPLDDKPVWSTTCFFVRKDYRGTGLSVALLKAASRYVKSRGGRIVEGYPVDWGGKRWPSAWGWTGFVGAFRRAGFKEVARPAKTRPIMRRVVHRT
jgi:GNAT superfamily N-acetyltransferase